ncbi:TPA: hypothetical protein ACN35J_004179 [Vibrio parahaemolyticus]|uniref:hypothetical protein n=1 Tax=Vibrio parahaemolyticus TaxID=670 RepID=UPI00040D8E99|nr:hypothetical protein [Vibrio parahaemolyticus]ELA9867006.1 hypothetical protein [Vibrio parahaemolyticus]ELI5381978.1 hypothetical protein [Vibrio parahaemolyticus]MBM5175451.1 hypothetical protein [Vibrio parahaemolyticus]MBM5198123.1 hypothetical protein [Vibrio parahaemolyticus]HCG5254968.1 hypothetical protein [Vibrio parahaemolyticus]
MKPLGTNNAIENGLTTPEKTSFQQANQLLNQQTHRADLQPKTDSQLPRSITTKERNNRLKNSNPLI